MSYGQDGTMPSARETRQGAWWKSDKCAAPLCRCGCGKPAEWLISGFSPEGTYEDEPACNSAAQYVEECAAEFNCEFSKKPITG